MGGKQKIVKKKGPKGKKARAKAKLDRQWGETAIIDDENPNQRKGKSRLLGQGSVRFGGETSERQPKGKTSPLSKSPRSALRKKDEPAKSYFSSGKQRQNDDDASISDSDSDSEAETAPLDDLLSAIRKSKKKRKAIHGGDDDSVSYDDEVMEDNASEDTDSCPDDSELEDYEPGTDENDDDSDYSIHDTEAENNSFLDLFSHRFGRSPFLKSELKRSPSTTRVTVDETVELHVSTSNDGNSFEGLLPNGTEVKQFGWQELAHSSFGANRKVLQRRWRRFNKRKVMSEDQASIYPFLTRYMDLLLTAETRKVGTAYVTCNQFGANQITVSWLTQYSLLVQTAETACNAEDLPPAYFESYTNDSQPHPKAQSSIERTRSQ